MLAHVFAIGKRDGVVFKLGIFIKLNQKGIGLDNSVRYI